MEKVVGTKKVDNRLKFCDRCGKLMHFDAKSERSLNVYFNYGWFSNNRDGDGVEYEYCQDCAPMVEEFLKLFNNEIKKRKYTNKELKKFVGE